jgi:putative NADH-flavin reductase
MLIIWLYLWFRNGSESKPCLWLIFLRRPVKESSSNSSGIRKAKKVKNVKKVKNNEAVLETLKKDLHEQNATKKPILNRQLVWNAFLKTFAEVEKLNKKQRQIMEFCTNKSRTPPKRKRRFLVIIHVLQ